LSLPLLKSASPLALVTDATAPLSNDSDDPATEKMWKMLRAARACELRDVVRAERMYRAALRFAERNWTDDSTNVADALFCLSLFYRKQRKRSASRRCWQAMKRLLHLS
jgi:hypothetical protein